MNKEILLVPVGNVPPEVFGWLADALPRVFACACRVAPPVPHPDFAWNKRREQYRAEAILAHVHAAGATCALAIADLDLYVPDLNFVFGLAQGVLARAIIAVQRLRQSFYGLPEDADVFRQRVVKEAVHELGHVFGLEHCRDRRCVMAFSNSLTDTDYKGCEFCPECRGNLPS
jgi:archaemetzincin